MASQISDLQIKGLYISPNNFSSVPDGALEIADNIVIDKQNIAESRRGQTQYATPLSVNDGQINELYNFSTTILANYDDKMAYDSGGSVFIDFLGTYAPPADWLKIKSLEAQRNFYFTTSEGIYKIDRLDPGEMGRPRPAGVPEALSGSFALTGASGFLEDDTAVAYRILWGYTDASGNLLRGAPSQRLVVPNLSGDSKDVILTYTIPDGITVNHFYQIYRSPATEEAAGEPSDELQLVLQGNPTEGQLAAKTFSVTDITPYNLMRETIYTATSQQGIENANYQPPWAIDIAEFKNRAFYANVKQKHQVIVSILGVNDPSLRYVTVNNASWPGDLGMVITVDDSTGVRPGMRPVHPNIDPDARVTFVPNLTQIWISIPLSGGLAGQTIEFQDQFGVGDIDYFAGSTNDASTNTFRVEDSFTPGDNIDETTLNLIQIINTSPTNNENYAYYLSGIDDLPGQFTIKERTLGGEAFVLTSSAGESFSPELPRRVIIGQVSSTNPAIINAVFHGLATGDQIKIQGSNSVPSVDGVHNVTVINIHTFTIPVDVTVSGMGGTFYKTEHEVISSNNAQQNRVFISKASQVEAVPLYSYRDIGSANFPIERVIALRDGIIFFKKDGIYRITGEDISSFTTTLVDNTVRLLAPESARAFNNQVFCFTNQGISAVTENEAQIMSIPIEGALNVLSSDLYPNFAKASFGVAYESSRQYMFFTVTTRNDTFATQAFIYNSLTRTWTRWVMNRTCGVVSNETDKLYMGEASTGQVMVERKTYTNRDYSDKEYPVEIVNIIDSYTYELQDVSQVAEGQSLYQAGRNRLISEVDHVNNIVYLDEMGTSNFKLGPASVHQPILNKIKWAPIEAGNPGILKQFSEATLQFRNAAFSKITLTVSTNILNTESNFDVINNAPVFGFGDFGWGGQAWGGELGGQVALRTYIPAMYQRGSWLSLSLQTNEAFTGFSLQGVSLMLNPMTSRFK